MFRYILCTRMRGDLCVSEDAGENLEKNKKEALEKAYNDDYAINEVMDFRREIIDEWED